MLTIMKKWILTLTLACVAICSYAQQNIRPMDGMEIASVENNNNRITLYKVTDAEGNPGFYLGAIHVRILLTLEYLNTTFSDADGPLLYLGASSEEAMNNLDALIALFSEEEGAQMEFTCRDGSTVAATIRKALLGKNLVIRETSVAKSDIKSLKASFKIARKLRPDL